MTGRSGRGEYLRVEAGNGVLGADEAVTLLAHATRPLLLVKRVLADMALFRHYVSVRHPRDLMTSPRALMTSAHEIIMPQRWGMEDGAYWGVAVCWCWAWEEEERKGKRGFYLGRDLVWARARLWLWVRVRVRVRVVVQVRVRVQARARVRVRVRV